MSNFPVALDQVVDVDVRDLDCHGPAILHIDVVKFNLQKELNR